MPMGARFIAPWGGATVPDGRSVLCSPRSSGHFAGFTKKCQRERGFSEVRKLEVSHIFPTENQRTGVILYYVRWKSTVQS